MRKNFKLALVPLALAGALASNSAFAGSSACLEIYDGDNNIANVGTYIDSTGAPVTVARGAGINFNGTVGLDAEYQNAECPENSGITRFGAGSVATNNMERNMIAFNPLNVAQEITKSLSINLFDPNISGTAVLNPALPATFSKNIVYIPTSPLPGGTRLTFQVDNATFVDDQVHLVALNDEDLDNSEPSLLAVVATTDGSPRATGTGETFDFVVPSGLTIPAGTRLAMSSETTSIETPTFAFNNDVCDVATSVNLSVPNAVNVIGGGLPIEGGQIVVSEPVITSTQQFAIFNNHATANGVVDALAPSLRKQFVVDIDPTGVDGADITRVYLQSNFLDRLLLNPGAGGVDFGVQLDGGDELLFSAVADQTVSSNVQLQLYDEYTNGGANADTFATNILFDSDSATLVSSLIPLDTSSNPTPTVHELEATDLFAQNADFSTTFGNPTFFALTQTDPVNDVINPSQFEVDFTYTLVFNESDLNDRCETTLNAYDIDTNGSVLKVPYHFQAGGNWIRVTNEFSQEAVITMDIQGEVGTVEAPNSSKSGILLDQVVPPNGSVLLYVDNLVTQAEMKAGYMSGGDVASGENQRHTITLVVSAPSDDVHGVAVQKVDGVDRVVPVLDLNNWQQ